MMGQSTVQRVVLYSTIITMMVGSLVGCGALIRNITRPTINHIIAAAMKQNDLELVRQGAPSYLIMIDGLVDSNPRDVTMLIAAAKLYSAYESAFVAGEEPERARRLSKRARDYAFRAMSLKNKDFAKVCDKPYEQFEPVAQTIGRKDVELLFVLTSTWANYIEAYRDNWDVVAEFPKVKLLARRLLELDEGYYYGFPHLILGVMDSLLPPALGGKPEEAQKHFKRAIQLGKGHLLQAYVLYASYYARMMGDRDLYQRLLTQVLKAPADVVPELTLVNTVAKVQAKELLEKMDETF